jgi:hypothetical protein
LKGTGIGAAARGTAGGDVCARVEDAGATRRPLASTASDTRQIPPAVRLVMAPTAYSDGRHL